MSHPGVIRSALREIDHHDNHNCFLKMIRMITIVLSRVSNDVTLSLNTARQHGIEKCVEKMLNFADQLRRLKVALQMILRMLRMLMMLLMLMSILSSNLLQVDHYEYVSMKVIVLLTSGSLTVLLILLFKNIMSLIMPFSLQSRNHPLLITSIFQTRPV